MHEVLGPGKIATIGNYRLYIEQDGRLFLSLDKLRLRVTPDEARALLDYMLLFARYFDGSQPETGPLVELNGHNNQAVREE